MSRLLTLWVVVLLLSGCSMDEPEQDTVIPRCTDQEEGLPCTEPGARCETDGWCCRCGCEGGRSCWCNEETGRWHCALEATDVCFYCDYNVDTSEPPPISDLADGEDATLP